MTALLCIACGRAVPAPIPLVWWSGSWLCTDCQEEQVRKRQELAVLDLLVAGTDLPDRHLIRRGDVG